MIKTPPSGPLHTDACQQIYSFQLLLRRHKQKVLPVKEMKEKQFINCFTQQYHFPKLHDGWPKYLETHAP